MRASGSVVGRGSGIAERASQGRQHLVGVWDATSESCRAVAPRDPRLGRYLVLPPTYQRNAHLTLRSLFGYSGASPYRSTAKAVSTRDTTGEYFRSDQPDECGLSEIVFRNA
jgi:hypothetical protein